MIWNAYLTSPWQALCSTNLQIRRNTPHRCWRKRVAHERKLWLSGYAWLSSFVLPALPCSICPLMSSAWERIIKDHTLIWSHCNRLNHTFFLVKWCLTPPMIFPFSSLSYFWLSLQRQNKPYHSCQRTSSKCFIKFWLQVSIKGRRAVPDECTEQGVQKRFLHNLFNHREAHSLAHAHTYARLSFETLLILLCSLRPDHLLIIHVCCVSGTDCSNLKFCTFVFSWSLHSFTGNLMCLHSDSDAITHSTVVNTTMLCSCIIQRSISQCGY